VDKKRRVKLMERSNTSVGVFAAVNFVFGSIFLFFILFMLLGLIYGVFFSGDPKEQIIEGVVGCIIIIVPSLAGLVIYGLAGYGLIKKTTWGYYLHVTGAVLAIFSCVGIIYSVIALVFAFREDFKSVFFENPNQIEITQ
jgi:hypothetical protein